MWGFLSGSLVKNPPTKQDTWVRFLAQEDPWKRKWHPTPVSCLGNPWTKKPGGPQPMGSQRVGHSLTTEQQQENPLLVLREPCIEKKDRTSRSLEMGTRKRLHAKRRTIAATASSQHRVWADTDSKHMGK